MKLWMERQRQLILLGTNNNRRNESVRQKVLLNELKQWEQTPPLIDLLSTSGYVADVIDSMVVYSGQLPNFSHERIMPDGKAQLIIDLDRPSAVVIGPHNSARDIPVNKKACQIIVRFQPHGLYLLTGIPQHRLFNRVLDAETIFGKAIRPLLSDLSSGQSVSKMEVQLHRFFKAKLFINYAPSVQEKVVRFVINHIKEPVSLLVKKSGYSSKHLTHLFRDYTGFTPKELQQVMQFANTIEQISLLPAHHLSGDVSDTGYYDQSHVIRQFKRFSGLTPSEYLKTGNSCSRKVFL